jgi:hypothetical protein
MQKIIKNFLALGFVLLVVYIIPCQFTYAATGSPIVTAVSKGPNQVNLSWTSPSGSFYGYIIEIQSDGDSRYSSFAEYKSIPIASGYSCTSSASYVSVGNTGCAISDPSGTHVYNPAINGVPPWVTETQYVDPQDMSAAQYIVPGLLSNVTYNFRVRTYTGVTNTVYGSYSNTASATTADYTKRFVTITGNDNNDGSAVDDSHAWRTLSKAMNAISCGTELIVGGGSYDAEHVSMNQTCSPSNKAVVFVPPGVQAAIVGNSRFDWGEVLALWGTNIVIDGLQVHMTQVDTNYQILVNGSHNAIFNMDAGPAVVPGAYGGIDSTSGQYNLFYHNYVHDYGSPYSGQNPNGQGGFPFALLGSATANNVVWSNHFTRGSHDTSLCGNGCNHNRWLNNIFDGGWGMALETVYDGSSYNLFEGSIGYHAARLMPDIYKPGIEISNGYNTLRRSVFVDNGGQSARILEVSGFAGDCTTNKGNLIYNNVFYSTFNASRGYFQSHNCGESAYDGTLIMNNIFKFTQNATEIYLKNMTPGAISYNDFFRFNGSGNDSLFVWGQDFGAPWENPQTLVYAQANYAPVFASNVVTEPQFVDVNNMDFHLSSGSPLRSSGAAVIDSLWGNQAAGNDLGAYVYATGVTSATPPVINSFVASIPTIVTGSSTTLSWSVVNANTLSINNGIGVVTGNSVVVSPSTSTTYTLTAINSQGSTGAQISVTVIPPQDTIPPLISGVVSSAVTSSSAIINWITNEVADAQVHFGTTFSYGSTVDGDPFLALAHTVNLVNLTSGTLYHYRVRSRDAAGNITIFPDQTFTTSVVSSGGGSGVITITPPVTATSTSSSGGQPAPGEVNNFISLKLINQSGTYYLIINNLKHGITNPGMLTAYGFAFQDAVAATAYDSSLSEGSLLLPADGALVKSQQDQTVYLISNQQRHGFTSAKVFLSLGFKFSSVLVVTNPELQALPKANQLLNNGSAQHLPGLDINKQGAIYWIGGDNKLQPYPDLATYNSWHMKNDFSRVVPANAADLSLPVGGVVGMRVIQ